MKIKLLLLAPLLIILFFHVIGCGNTANVNINTNHAPVIRSLTASPASVVIGNSATILCNAFDEDGNSISYTWSAVSGLLSSTTGSTVLWTAPSAAGTYTINVQVSDGKSSNAGSISILVTSTAHPTPTGSPDAPTTLTVSNITDITANLIWDAKASATNYTVSYGTDAAASNLGTFSVLTNNYMFTDLTDNTTYYIKVLAINSAGSSPYSSIVSFETLSIATVIPTTPTNLIISSITDGTANLTWESVLGASRYKVSCGTDTNAMNIGVFTTTVNNYDFSGLSSNETYYIKVLAENSAGSSPYASIISFKTLAASTSGYSFVSKWGTLGSANGQLNFPTSIAVSGSGEVYVIDLQNYRIQTFDSNGSFINTWSFWGQYGITVDKSSNDVYATDNSNDCIHVYDANGLSITNWGNTGSANGQFNQPLGIAVNGSGKVYVADTYNYRIQVFDSNGSFESAWGSLGSASGQFQSPVGIAIDSAGNIYVTDRTDARIQKFNSSGSFITNLGSGSGSGDGQFSVPWGIAIDSSDNVYVADYGNNRIQKFNSSGSFVTKWGSLGSGDGQFNNPYGIAVDSDGNVYVADTKNNRIQKFSPNH